MHDSRMLFLECPFGKEQVYLITAITHPIWSETGRGAVILLRAAHQTIALKPASGRNSLTCVELLFA